MTPPRGPWRRLRCLSSVLAGAVVFAVTLYLTWSGFTYLWERPSEVRDVLIVLIMAPFMGFAVAMTIALTMLALALLAGGSAALWLWPAKERLPGADAVAEPALEGAEQAREPA